MKFFKLFILFTIFIGQNSFSKEFSNQYCSFVLPPGWSCVIEGAEYVCQSENKQRQKEAIIILAAKLKGDQDTLQGYKKYLEGAKNYQIPGGSKQISEPKYTKEITKNNQRWVDSLHLASEVPGFYTRYMATVKEDLGIAVTFSVAKDKYSNYQGMFEKVIETLRVFRQRKVDLAKFKKTNTDFADDLDLDDDDIDDGAAKIALNQKKKKQDKDSSGLGGSSTLLLLLLVGAGAFVFLKKKKG